MSKHLKRHLKNYLALVFVLAWVSFAVANTGTISDAVSGTRILASDFNKITGAFKVDLVPRNNSGIATAEGGSLGSSTYPWDALYFGAAASGISINDSAGAIVFKTGNTTRATISSTGLSLASIADGLITFAKLDSTAKFYERITTYTSGSGNFTVPAGVTEIEVEGIGAGGSGASGNGAGNSGGGGGGGSGEYGVIRLSVTPGATLAYSVGAGVSGPPQTGVGSAGSNGTAGNNTTFTDGTRTFTWRGGAAGSVGTNSGGGAGGAGGSLTVRVPFRNTSGGAGSVGGVASTAGESTAAFSGGAAASGNPTGGNGGGGGASVFGAGGAGGAGGLGGGGVGAPGVAASATAYGAGGGGGGSQETPTAPGRGGAGGASAGGLLRIRYVSGG